jgi:DNA polymerase-4
MNAFYISCEMTRNRALVGRPAAVAGDPKKRTGIILAANYEARACGVKTAMVLHEALKHCPGMALVPPDHAFYDRKSKEVMDLLSQYTPLLEQNSIDEAWLDMTGSERLFGKPSEAANRIMGEIKDQLGLWCSVGIGENKFIAKMAAEMKKPLGITELWTEDLPAKLWPLPVQEMYGVGSKSAEKLNHMAIRTIGDLAKADMNRLIKAFGKGGQEIHAHANGIDHSPVTARLSDDVKSIGRSTTLPEDLSDLEQDETDFNGTCR